MREILFRGQDAGTGHWIKGFFVRLFDGKGNVSHRIYSGYAETDCEDYYPDFWEVDPETVGQYTGLTDKNGKKIFTGDIISADNGKQSCVAVVKFGEYYPKMFYKMLHMFTPGKLEVPACGFFAESVDNHEEMILFQSRCVTVIGNIHDNPELLEG